MRKQFILNLVISMFLITPVFAAEPETLLGGQFESGGFGGPQIKFTNVNDQFGVMVGGHGGWLINHTFVLGGAGYGLVNEVDAPSEYETENDLFLELGYGGLYLEYINDSNNLVHFTVHTLIGAGGLTFSERRFSDHDWEYQKDSFFVFEPGVNVMVNITEFFRVGLGATYRYVDGIELSGLSGNDLSGPTAMINFRFGRF